MPAYQDTTSLRTRLTDEFVLAAQRGDDLGMILSEALADAARSLESTAKLVSGRPGSWESDLLLRLTMGALPSDDPAVDRRPFGDTA